MYTNITDIYKNSLLVLLYLLWPKDMTLPTAKKIFAVLACLVLLVPMFPSILIWKRSYPLELEQAHIYAYTLGITDEASIYDVWMYNTFTRAQLAQMISVFAMDVLGRQVNSETNCTFSDIDQQNDYYTQAIITACQLWLMGINTQWIFNPDGIVGRADFGTTLSRTLWGNLHDGNNPVYLWHLHALQEAGIMQVIDHPEMREILGYAFMMLHRASIAMEKQQ
jgi:hypothetical protein